MKISPVSTCLAMILCFASSAHASAAFYARPSLYYTKVSVANGVYTSGKLGLGVAAGCALGSKQSFALELEAVSTTGMKAHDVYGSSGSTTTEDTKVDMTQCLFSFRYTVLPMDSAVRIFVGPTAGYWTEKGGSVRSTTFSYSSVVYPATTSSGTERGFLLGPTLGAAIKVNNQAKIELAYRQLWMLTSDGHNGHLTQQLCVGFNYRF